MTAARKGPLQQQPRFALEGTSCNGQPFCACTEGVFASVSCYTVNMTGWGHPGLDWASGYPFAGWQEGLNFSIAYTFNSFRGMNTTLDSLGNGQTHMYQTLSCRVYEAAVQARFPHFPDFKC